ncbi:MAG: ABC transporter ATP-binding protein [Polyangiales bacterium]
MSRRFGDRAVVRDVSLTVARGEMLCLLGGSGSGKSTTLRLINRLLEVTSGEVRVDGRDVRAVDPPTLRRGIGYVFQQAGLFPHWTVAENIGATPSLLGWSARRVAARVDEHLALVELDPAVLRHRLPRELSGGQAQRVAVARALAAEAPVVLLDEPFGALDAITRATLQARFAEIQRALGLTAVFVTHDVSEAVMLGDRIAVLRDGALVQIGTAHALATQPADDTVAALMRAPLRHAEALRARIARSDGA